MQRCVLLTLVTLHCESDGNSENWLWTFCNWYQDANTACLVPQNVLIVICQAFKTFLNMSLAFYERVVSAIHWRKQLSYQVIIVEAILDAYPEKTKYMLDFKFSRLWLWSSESCGMYCRVLNRMYTDVSQVRATSIIRATLHLAYLIFSESIIAMIIRKNSAIIYLSVTL